MKHILIIRLSAMGDVAMTVPVLKAFSLQHPDVKITVLSRTIFAALFEDIDNVSFFAADLKGKHKGFFGLIKLFFELKKLKFTHVADLHNVLRSKIIKNLFAIIGIKTVATDKFRTEKKQITALKTKQIFQLKTMFERHADTFEKLGFVVDLTKPFFRNQINLTPKIIEIVGQKHKNWIGIAPFAQHQAKVYPENLMQIVIDELAKTDNKIFLFGGGKHEINKLNNFKKQYNNVEVIAGKLSFKEELGLISNLNLMLSMDSGNAHLAAIFGVKTITLWGATHPFVGFLPYFQPIENCLLSNRENFPFLPTSVYGNKKIEGYDDVMRTISPEVVVKKVLEFIN